MSIEPVKTDDDDLLTAYLDNELSEPEMERFRARLVQDDDLRKRLAELQRAWDLLDDLPDPLADQAFTKSTLELVTASIVAGNELAKPNLQQSTWSGLARYWPFGLVIGLALAGLMLGFAYRIYNERSELRSIEMVANYQGLKVLSQLSKGNLDIQQLVDRVTSIPDWERLADAVHKARMLPTVPKELSVRRAWLQGLTVEQQAMIWRNDRDYHRADRGDIQKLTLINKRLASTTDLEVTHRVLNVVAAVVDALPDNERSILGSLPESERLQRIRELCCLSLADWYAVQFESMNPDELVQQEYQAIVSWFEALPPVVRETFARNILFRRNTFSFEESLIQNLSPSPRSWFLALKEKEREAMAVKWAFAILRSETTGQYPENTLYQFYLEKDPSVQESLDLLSPTDLNNQLSRELFRPRRTQNNQGERRTPRDK
jgi:hypothetical protein